MRNRFIIVIVSLLFSTSIFAQSMRRYDLKQLKYNLSKEAVVKLWGDPDNKSETGIILYEYNTEDSVIYLNFFTDNKLCYVWEKDKNNKITEHLIFKHSFFTDSRKKGKYKFSGYESEKNLIKKGYVQKYFYFSHFMHEHEVMRRKSPDMVIEKFNYYAFKEDRIIYSFYIIGNTGNMTVCAYILSDDNIDSDESENTEIGFIKYDKNGDGVIEEAEGDYFNNRYYLEIKDGLKPRFINFDINNDGNLEENEGCLLQY